MSVEGIVIAIALVVGLISVISTAITLVQRQQQLNQSEEEQINIEIGGRTKSLSELTSPEVDRIIHILEKNTSNSLSGSQQ